MNPGVLLRMQQQPRWFLAALAGYDDAEAVPE
jgi:hypothetical protein